MDEYRRLASDKAQAVARLKTGRQQRQLNKFLDNFLIKRSTIPGIGPAKTVTLASFGIELAADVSQAAIENIPGFGPATAAKLSAWRARHERRFVYNPALTPQDAQEQAKIEADYAAKMVTFARRVSGGKAEMDQILSTFRHRLAVENSELGRIAIRRAQLEADLRFLGVSKPVKRRTTAHSSPSQMPSQGPSSAPASQPPPSHSAAPTSPTSGMTCPRCGAVMVRRTARRGARAGHSFWGCSRFPLCQGTRN